MSDAELPPYYEPSIPFAHQRSELRAAIGRDVGAKLDSTPGVWRLSSSLVRPVQLYVGAGFLAEDECRSLSSLIDATSYPSPLYEKDRHEGVRTSDSCNLDPTDPLIASIDSEIARFLGIAPRLGEPLQGQRYSVGQRFKAHADFFYIDEPYWAEYETHGGQRTWTAMIYLNEPEKGGATAFKFLDLAIAAQTGKIVIWNNMAVDGSPNPWTFHEGLPVEEGTKYIATKWYRERPVVS